MMALIATMLMAWLILVLAPATPIGRVLRAALVTMPAMRLAGISRGRVVLLLAVAVLAGVVAWLVGHEALQLAGLAAPEIAAALTSVELAAYADALIAVVLTATTMNLRRVGGPARPRRAMPRARRVRRAEHAANDDDAARRAA